MASSEIKAFEIMPDDTCSEVETLYGIVRETQDRTKRALIIDALELALQVERESMRQENLGRDSAH